MSIRNLVSNKSLFGKLRHSDIHLFLENGRFDIAVKHHYMTKNERWRASRKRWGRKSRW